MNMSQDKHDPMWKEGSGNHGCDAVYGAWGEGTEESTGHGTDSYLKQAGMSG